MKVLVCGGREYTDARKLYSVLDGLHAKHNITLIINGGAHGADYLGRLWARERKVPCSTYPADWDRHGRSAGPVRNQRMLDEAVPDLVVAFPGGSGTANMIQKAEAAGVEVRRIE